MAGAAATMAGSALLLAGSVTAIAALSHCPRRIRMWPAMLLASAALVMSDRSVVLMGGEAPLSAIRWLLAVFMLGSAAGTVAAMAHVITTACPLCRSAPQRGGANRGWELQEGASASSSTGPRGD